MRYFLLTIILYFGQSAIAQNKDVVVATSEVMSSLSILWKEDSLAKNSFRLDAKDKLLKSRVDSVSVSYLIEKFGKPNRVQKTNKGISYWYHFYDALVFDSQKNYIEGECGAIVFNFSEAGKLVDIGEIIFP